MEIAIGAETWLPWTSTSETVPLVTLPVPGSTYRGTATTAEPLGLSRIGAALTEKPAGLENLTDKGTPFVSPAMVTVRHVNGVGVLLETEAMESGTGVKEHFTMFVGDDRPLVSTE